MELLRAKDGGYRSLEWSARLEGGCVYATAREVSRRVEAEHALADMSRIQAGKFSISTGPLWPSELLESTLSNLEPMAVNRGVGLRTRIAAALPRLEADPQRVGQVVSNLVNNAFKFTQQGGWVEVRAALAGDMLRVEVEDNGPGIARADQDRLFKTFSQLDMTNTRRTRGVGLGLSICKTLVEAHGGQIGVVSAAGEGSTFWFTLPLGAEARGA